VRKLAFFVSGLLLVGLMWAWLQGADVPDGTIVSTDYDPGVTAVGAKVLADLQALETAVNNIDSSQVDESANIPASRLLTNSMAYNKLTLRTLTATGVKWAFGLNSIDSTYCDSLFRSRSIASSDIQFSVPVITGDPGNAKTAWGATKFAATIAVNESIWVKIVYADSTDVGDPAFTATPRWFVTPLFGEGACIGRNPVAFVNVYNTKDSVSGWLYCVGPQAIAGTIELSWFAIGY
jgi:hypothetical protein